MQDYIIPILGSLITAIASYIGVQLKNAYKKYVNTKTKERIVKATVQYVEQISKDIMYTNEQKYDKAKEKALEWLKSVGIKVSDTELDILIESAVNSLKKEV